MVVVWNKNAEAELEEIYRYIQQESAQNAEMVVNEFYDLTAELSQNPEKYPADKYKTNNDDRWRAFEKYHYRISYRIGKDKIRIIRIRHTSRSPLTY